MSDKRGRIEEYRQTGYYYIPTGICDLLWSDSIGEWRMSTSAKNMRSCIELDRVDRELDEFGYEIILGEFCLDPDKYKLEQVKHMSPAELGKLRVF
ncbi:MAG TPA: hypothetical protein VJ441_02360 [Dehalococcoidia bacterium]|nr:hypothetical protein [Dehalococcoidia bacterium]